MPSGLSPFGIADLTIPCRESQETGIDRASAVWVVSTAVRLTGLGTSCGKLQCDDRATANSISDPDRTAHDRHELVGDHKSEAVALGIVGSLRHTGELIEQPASDGRRETRSFVADL